jgi:hypothetical protein
MVNLLLFQPCLFQQPVYQADTQIRLGVRHADMPWFGWVRKYVMATFHATQCPSVRFELPDNLLAIHGGYYNHSESKVNARNKHRLLGKTELTAKVTS